MVINMGFSFQINYSGARNKGFYGLYLLCSRKELPTVLNLKDISSIFPDHLRKS